MFRVLCLKRYCTLVREAVELINLEDISNLEGTLTYNAISIIKNATDFESNPTLYVEYVNCIFYSITQTTDFIFRYQNI